MKGQSTRCLTKVAYLLFDLFMPAIASKVKSFSRSKIIELKQNRGVLSLLKALKHHSRKRKL